MRTLTFCTKICEKKWLLYMENVGKLVSFLTFSPKLRFSILFYVMSLWNFWISFHPVFHGSLHKISVFSRVRCQASRTCWATICDRLLEKACLTLVSISLLAFLLSKRDSRYFLLYSYKPVATTGQEVYEICKTFLSIFVNHCERKKTTVKSGLVVNEIDPIKL